MWCGSVRVREMAQFMVSVVSTLDVVDTKTVADVLFEGTGSSELKGSFPSMIWPGDIVWTL